MTDLPGSLRKAMDMKRAAFRLDSFLHRFIECGSRPINFFVLSAALVSAVCASTAHADPEPLKFNRDVRPILSDACFRCHGFDQHSREADLRLDIREGALADRDGAPVIIPGKPEESELIRRITSHDESEQMPPPEANKKLTKKQIDILRRWIADGAEYEPHWSFVPPTKAPLPSVKNKSWPQNPIDHFILAELEKRKLSPSPEAEKTTLLRRVTFDLTGLPPTLEEID